MIAHSPAALTAPTLGGLDDIGPIPAVAAVVLLVAVLVVVVLAARWARGRFTADQVLTLIAAGIATAVAAQGMWLFFADVVGVGGWLRWFLFAFLEIAVLASAMRARRSILDDLPAGVDGLAVWVLTSVSAVLSSLHARSFGEALFRLLAPLVAAWLWHRGMASERVQRHGTDDRTTWRLSPQRVLTRLRLIDPTDRTSRQVSDDRNLMAVALAAQRVRWLRAAEARPRRLRRAERRLDKTVRRAVAYSGLGVDAERQQQVLQLLKVLYSAQDLVDMPVSSPWKVPVDAAPDSRSLVVQNVQTEPLDVLDAVDSPASRRLDSLDGPVSDGIQPLGPGESSGLSSAGLDSPLDGFESGGQTGANTSGELPRPASRELPAASADSPGPPIPIGQPAAGGAVQPMADPADPVDGLTREERAAAELRESIKAALRADKRQEAVMKALDARNGNATKALRLLNECGGEVSRSTVYHVRKSWLNSANAAAETGQKLVSVP